MKRLHPRSRRRLVTVAMVVVGHSAFFWQLARGLEHRPPPEGPVWMSSITLPEPLPASATPPVAPTLTRAADPVASARAQPGTVAQMASTPTTPVALAQASPSERQPADRFQVAAPTQVLYEVSGKAKGFPYFARSNLLWQHDGQRYQLRFEVGLPLLGSRTQTSVGALNAQGLAPQRFGDKNKTELAAHFERDKGWVTFSANTPASPLLPGAQDRLSLFMQLAAQLAGAPQRYPAGTVIDLPTVSAREAEIWSFVVDGEERISLPLGDVQALHLRRLPRREYDQRIDLWFAPSLAYLPVRIRLQQANGDEIDQRAKSISPP